MGPEALVYIHFPSLAYAPEQIMSPKLHIYVELQCYCSLHMDPTVLHVQVCMHAHMYVCIKYNASHYIMLHYFMLM